MMNMVVKITLIIKLFIKIIKYEITIFKQASQVPLNLNLTNIYFLIIIKNDATSIQNVNSAEEKK